VLVVIDAIIVAKSGKLGRSGQRAGRAIAETKLKTLW